MAAVQRPKWARAGAILLDNSTYMSFKGAIEGMRLDSTIVYNLANFIESLVLAEDILIAPSTIWAPTQSDDPLFFRAGPCRQLSALDWSDEQLGSLFLRAIQCSLRDVLVANPGAEVDLGVGDRVSAQALLHTWAKEAANDPRKFLDQYSGIVLWTDDSSLDVLRRHSPSLLRERTSRSRRLAQYLLRTNVALELATSVPYHPHSHRLPIVHRRLQEGRDLYSGTLALLATSEALIHNKVLLRTARLSSIAPFRKDDPDVPLVLSAVLNMARNARELTEAALELRRDPGTIAYREWMSRLLDAVQHGNARDRANADAAFSSARTKVSSSIAKYFDPSHRAPTRDLSVLAAVDVPSELIRGNLAGAAVDAAKLATQLPGWMKRLATRRRVAILIHLARERRRIASMNQSLLRVFGQGLDDVELSRLVRLRTASRRGAASDG